MAGQIALLLDESLYCSGGGPAAWTGGEHPFTGRRRWWSTAPARRKCAYLCAALRIHVWQRTFSGDSCLSRCRANPEELAGVRRSLVQPPGSKNISGFRTVRGMSIRRPAEYATSHQHGWRLVRMHDSCVCRQQVKLHRCLSTYCQIAMRVEPAAIDRRKKSPPKRTLVTAD